MDLSGLRAPRPMPPKLSSGDRKVQMILRDLEKIRNSKRPRKQMKRSEDLIYRIVQTLRKTGADHIMYTTCIWTLISIFRLFPEPAKEMMLAVGVPGVLHQVIASGLLSGSMRQYTSELCFFLSSNQPYPDASGIPQTGPLLKLPEVSHANMYNAALDDVSVTSSEMSSTVPEGHFDHSKYAFVPYRINEQNLHTLEQLFKDGYEKQVTAALPNPEFMSRFGFAAATARKPFAGTGTGIVGQDWEAGSESDEEDEDLQNHDDGSINSTISSGSRSLAYSMSSAGNTSLGGGGSVRAASVGSGRYTFSSGVSGQGPPVAGTETHGIGIGLHNRQMGKYAGTALGVASGGGRLSTAPAMREYDSWHERHAPHENPFYEEATPLSTHYRPKTISGERAQATHFRIGGFGTGPAAARDVNATSAIPALGADFAKGRLAEVDGFELASPSASFTLSQISNEPFGSLRSPSGGFPDQFSSTVLPGSPGGQQDQFPPRSSHSRHPHTRALLMSKSLNEESWQGPHRAAEGKRPAGSEVAQGGGMFTAPLRSIAASQYGDRPADLLQQAHQTFTPSVSLLDVSPTKRHLHTAGSPTRPFPSLTGAVHARREQSHSPAHPSTAPQQQPNKRGLAKEPSRAGRSEINDLLATLDPLSLSLNAARAGTTGRSRRANTVGRKAEDGASRGSWQTGDDDEDDQFDDENSLEDDDDSQSSATEAGYFDSHLVDAPGSKFNEFLARKKMRIRAEKLIDHNFTKKLFSKKATTAQVQNLISRMESLLQLMDPQNTGFVTWECFARLILAVAPSHLLRADVMAFMAAQTDNDQNQIDYKEFIISGKVMVIEKQRTGKDNLPVMGWLNRQKLYSGEESTHTWQNHLKWYQARKAKAVVWLMRRATRSMRHSELLAEAQVYLMNQRKRALAVTYLLEVGYVAVNSQGAWKEAKRALLKRAMHARRVSQQVIAAQAWLSNLAKGVVEQLRFEDEQAMLLDDDASMASRASSIESVMYPVKKKQADYATFFKLHQYNHMAFTFLTNSAAKAQKHCDKQDAVQATLKAYGYRMMMHQLYTESARNWLKMAGERAYQYCMYRDDTMKNLFRRGQHALRYMVRQEHALAWLLARGKEAVVFVESKAESLCSLITQGQRTLAFLNAREIAFASLVVRRQKAVVLVARKKEAFSFLKKQPLGLWANQDKIAATQVWLAQRGVNAIAHLERRAKAFKLLQFTAGKASTVLRKQNIAFTDLQQFGQQARLARFAAQCKTVPQYAKRVKEERQRIVAADNKRNKERAAMPKEQRWKAELNDAFDFLAVSVTPPVYQGGKKPLVGRVGFLKLMQYGKLLGTTRPVTYEFFKAVDPGTACFVPFEAVWTWFLHHAQSYETIKLAPQGKELKFTIRDIVSAEERAQLAVLKRVNSEKIEFKSDLDWDALEDQRRRAAEEASSSEDEEPEEEIDDETLFSDPLLLQSADVGRLMKYLTKRKHRREREVQEEAYQAEQKAKLVAAAKAAEAARKVAHMAPFTPSAKLANLTFGTGAAAGDEDSESTAGDAQSPIPVDAASSPASAHTP